MTQIVTAPEHAPAMRWRMLLVVGLALAAAATGLPNGFAYDDVHLVVQNPRVHSLVRLPALFVESYWPPVAMGPPGRLYRPLTTAALAIQWSLGGGSPLLFHLISSLLYALVALLVLALALRLLPAGPATLAASLFAVHPVHTEVVGNVVGQAELLAAIAGLLFAALVIDGTRAGWNGRRMAGVAAAFALGLLAKEHVAALALLFPFLVLAAGGWPALRREATGRLLLLLAIVIILYLSLRVALLGSLAGDLPHPFWRGVPLADRWLTVLGGLPVVARLFLWPVHLQADYAPQELPLLTSATASVVGGLLLLVGIGVTCWIARRSPAAWLGAVWLLVTLLPASNLLFPTGVVLAERTLFLPSAGLCLLVAAAYARLGGAVGWGSSRSLLLGGLGWLTILVGLARSALRLPVWRDNHVLFATTAADAPRSYWAWRNLAGDLVLQGRAEEARAAYARSLSLFDRDPTVYDDLAGLERREHRCERSVPLMEQALRLDPDRHQTAARLIGCLVTLGHFEAARRVARGQLRAGQEEFRSLLALVDSAEQARHLSSPTPR